MSQNGNAQAGLLSGDNALGEIELHVLKAVNELLRRAGAPDFAVVDRKDEAPSLRQGVVQDCEFGLMVLVARKALEKHRGLQGELADAGRVKALVLALVQRAVYRLTDVSNIAFVGGALDGSPVFFTGEPYTVIRAALGGEAAFSANLDAAMLTVAFLAAALEEFDAELSALDPPESEELRAQGVRNLRDAALFVCHEGFLYAQRCRVHEADRFAGYTCDPTSNLPGPPAGLLEERDRLFFTWTVCETIHELQISGWMSYLEGLQRKDSAPPFVAGTKGLLQDLLRDLKRASLWCRESFLEGFRSLTAPPVGRIVSDFGKLGANKRPSAELDKDCDLLADYVTNVYHLSQYAAIRSIEPVDISIGEVNDIVGALDNLVSQHILASGLDASAHPRLFRTLTRSYSLGESNEGAYKDDAYFPLVVRSLASLLTRTVTTLSRIATRDEILAVVSEFRRSLKARYENLLDRRPENLEQGDGLLWSYVSGGPYVLYATQRSVYSLLEYAKFLAAVENLGSGGPRPLEAIQGEIRDLLAKSLAEVVIGPVIHKFLENVNALHQPGVAAPSNGNGTPHPLPLPAPEWTHPIILAWLAQLNSEFEANQIDHLLRQRVSTLVQFQQILRSGQIDPRTQKSWENSMKTLAKLCPDLATLDREKRWHEENLLPVVFEYLFRRYLEGGRPMKSAATEFDVNDEGNLWAIVADLDEKMNARDRRLDSGKGESQ